ncbi:MAG: tripartite tricarboxylate transporter substrate binding protein [Xanthobacteraceae bacterium]|jgi:tripartite-type tricarboxylate transporter receptor subunit TctC
MKLVRRQFLRITWAAAVMPALSRFAHAEAYPVRPARIVAGYAAGSGLDVYARLIGQWLSGKLGQNFIVENRVGAGTNLAVETVVNAAPDGYTLLMASAAQFTNATLYKNLNFDFIRDTVPVASVARGPFIIVVNPLFPAKTTVELIAYAKANPGKVTFGSSGTGTLSHVSGELFKSMAGINMIHVPYRGEPPAITNLMAGQLDVFFSTAAGSSEFVRSGKLRALGVTSAQRLAAFPDVPTVGETLPGYDATPWAGICAPKGIPAAIVSKLNATINAGLADPKLKAQFDNMGSPVAPMSPEDYGKAIVAQTEKWAKVIHDAGIELK